MGVGILGKDCVLALNTGSFDTPTFGAIPEATEVSIAQPKASGGVSGRGDSVKTYRTGMRDVKITGKIAHRKGNTNMAAFITAFNAGTSLLLAALDGPHATAGSEGPHGAFEITKLDRNEPDEDGVTYDFELVPCNAEEFEWLEIS